MEDEVHLFHSPIPSRYGFVLKLVYCVAPFQVLMSSLENAGPTTKYEFKGRFGAPVTNPQVEEPTHEEIDRFVKSMLGLTKEK